MKQTEVEKAMLVLKKAFENDPEYAYGWHSNIAMAYVDVYYGIIDDDPNIIGNKAATQFMKICFDVETSQDMLDNKDEIK